MRTITRLLFWSAALAAAALAQSSQPDLGVPDTEFRECTGNGGAFFELNAVPYIDPNGDPATYWWTGPFGTVQGPTGTVFLELGAHEIGLVETTYDGETKERKFYVVVIDTHEPTVTVTATPSKLPAELTLRTINVDVEVSDVCGAGTSFSLLGVTDSDPATGRVSGAEIGQADASFQVLSSRPVDGGSRVYTAYYEARDASGNTSTASASIVVGEESPFPADPGALTFNYSRGGPPPPSQTTSLTAETYSSYRVTSSEPWAWADESAGETPAQLRVSVNGDGLAPGLHGAVLTVEAGSGYRTQIPVLLRVFDPPQIYSLPESLSLELDTFTGKGGLARQTAPLAADIFVGSRGTRAKLQISTDEPWLQAVARDEESPTMVTVGAMPAGMGPGVYTGNVTISTDNEMSEPLLLPVTLTVTSSATFLAPEFVVNAATMERKPVAPGSIITAFLFNPDGVTANAVGLPLPTTLGGLSARVNGRDLPLFHASAGQLNAQLPIDIEPGVATMELFFQGEKKGQTTLQIIPAAPGVFAQNGRALAINQDGSLNGPDRPALRGSYLSLFLTGQGATDPPVPAGSAAPGAPFALAALPVTAIIDGSVAEVRFAGLAPEQAGLLQVQLGMADRTPGEHEATIFVGGTPSNAVTIYVGR
ncbi:MAG: hypothetical protein GC160_00480 [Acidobacteria bacterium]|nr:hypothetical protein [Acidobacteriota bacterium]